MTGNQIIEQYSGSVMPTYDRFPYAFESGKGAILYDFEGKEYVDFSSGIGVNSIGYANDRWLIAVSEQMKKLPHISNLFYTEPCLKLAQLLTSRSGLSSVFFSNSGAEANEGMIKLARKYSFDKYGNGRANIVTLKNSFHGRTIATVEATGQERFHNYFFPFTGGFTYAEANNIESVKEALGSNSCAVLIELIQGEGGVCPLAREFVKELRKLCSESDLLLLIDEVQTGIGRTGSLFAFQQYDIMPDVVSFAKGIAGGLPMGGFISADSYSYVLSPGTHAATFGGNPVCSSAGIAVLEILDETILKEVSDKGEYIKKAVLAMNSPYFTEIRGLGLMLGIRLSGIGHRDLAVKLLEKGLICLTAGADVLRMLPPLTITYEEIDKGLDILRQVIAE